MINFIKTEDTEKYEGYGYTLLLRNVINPITNRENIIAETNGGNLIKLNFLSIKSGLSLNILPISITKNILPIFDEEYKNAMDFLRDFEEIKKNSMFMNMNK